MLQVIEFIVLKMDNAYKIPNFRVRGRACKTHLPSNTAFRGFGFPQSGLFAETWVTAVATQTGLPPEKVNRLKLTNKMRQNRGLALTEVNDQIHVEKKW